MSACEKKRWSFLARRKTEGWMGKLLNALRGEVGSHQRLENRQHMPAVIYDALEQRPQFRFPRGFPIPLGQGGHWDFDVPAQLSNRMASQEQAIKKGCLPLREFKVPQRFVNPDRRSR